MKNFLKIVFVIDESGSMHGSESDVIGGFNSFVERQKNESSGKIIISMYKFNTVVTPVITNKPAEKVNLLNAEDYRPGGSTALYDATGLAISETHHHISKMSISKRPDKVMFVIITDGEENASREFTFKDVKTLISSHEINQHWDFIFLGTGLEDFVDADRLGIKYRASSKKANLKSKFGNISNYFVSYFANDNSSDSVNMDQLMKDMED